MLSEEAKRRVLVVDDEASVRESLKMLLNQSYEVDVAESAENALEMFADWRGNSKEEIPGLVLLDVLMPGIDGIEFLKQLKEEHPAMPVIMLSASNTVRTAVSAMKLGAVDYLSKPFDVEELLELINRTIQEAGKSKPIASSSRETQSGALPLDIEGTFGSMVGSHDSMQQLYHKIDQVALRDTTVLITGESGTGKELVANRRSPRAEGPFVALNCAAIPDTLIESELFGHEQGAFTHAVGSRQGHFELADGGTLFLDEIGELSLPVQVKMLRFLQEKEFYRVGKSKPTKVDVRIIAATNKSLESAISEGSFRQDLFYRINVVTLEPPPLRERSEDIPELFQFFVKRLAPVYGGKEPTVTSECLETLCCYQWPGNVRELENVTESVLALCTGDLLDVEDLPARLRGGSAGGNLRDRVLQGEVGFEEAEREFEREIIERALEQCDFVQTRAAEMLGISRRILKYKMDKLGIEQSSGE